MISILAAFAGACLAGVDIAAPVVAPDVVDLLIAVGALPAVAAAIQSGQVPSSVVAAANGTQVRREGANMLGRWPY